MISLLLRLCTVTTTHLTSRGSITINRLNISSTFIPHVPFHRSISSIAVGGGISLRSCSSSRTESYSSSNANETCFFVNADR